MSNLVTIVRFQPKAMQKKGALPLMMEFEVVPETAPFLVTSTSSLLWVEEAHPGSKVKVAVRSCPPGVLFQEIVREVARRGVTDEWGNVHPVTPQGLENVRAHLASYDLTEIEFLMAPVKGKKGHPEWLKVLPVTPAPWVPVGWVVVVPKDREYVGMLGHLDSTHLVLLVHNASRSIGILK
jgi:hypothetical protein